MKPSRIFIIALLAVFGLLQYKLWISPEGASQYWRLKNQISEMDKGNAELQARNSQVTAEVENLKQGNDAIEERARNDLGLVKSNEIFYQIVE
jgi:cell division protein FtsB